MLVNITAILQSLTLDKMYQYEKLEGEKQEGEKTI